MASPNIGRGLNETLDILQQVYYLSFLLPSYFDLLGNQCNQFSRHFCVLGFGSYTKQGNRVATPDDRDEFHALISTSFFNMNWFSFKKEDAHSMGCCLYQVNTYLDQGQRIGYSPQEYYEKIANLGTTLVKQDLVYVKPVPYLQSRSELEQGNSSVRCALRAEIELPRVRDLKNSGSCLNRVEHRVGLFCKLP
ncbi:uncharacterized protein LOC142349704 [Convolutriloba macropyga]|uniref:uncharacterized protein LOC142349704 n=1 Tax=Convolutriloba macropyga TaxID=536237 RepID=UPI003F524223